MIGKWDSRVFGNLGKDPDMVVTQSGVQICKFPLAINRKRKGEEYVNWVTVVAFEKLGQLCQQYCQKGSRVCVDGLTEIRKFTGRDGLEKVTVDITASDVMFLDRKGDADSPRAGDPGGVPSSPDNTGDDAITDENIPF